MSFDRTQGGTATSGGMGPIIGGDPITLALSVGVQFIKLIGQGRKEADYLTKPPQGAQYLVGQAHVQLVANYGKAKAAGVVTRAVIQNYIDAFNKLNDDFHRYVQEKGSAVARAGPGAIATIDLATATHVGNLQRELAATSPYSVFTGDASKGNLETTLAPLAAAGVSPSIALLIGAAALFLFLRR